MQNLEKRHLAVTLSVDKIFFFFGKFIFFSDEIFDYSSFSLSCLNRYFHNIIEKL